MCPLRLSFLRVVAMCVERGRVWQTISYENYYVSVDVYDVEALAKGFVFMPGRRPFL